MALPAFIASAFPHIARLFAGNAARAATTAAATQAPRLGLGGIINSAYGNGGMGLMNLGMDVIPLAMDIANNDVGLKSFSSFGGTMLGTKFGGRELNRLGETNLEKAKRGQTIYYNSLPKERRTVSRDEWLDSQAVNTRKQLELNPKTSRQGYNMPIGFAADAGLYSLTAGMNKPKPTDFETQMMQGQSVSPVTRYIQMTGGL